MKPSQKKFATNSGVLFVKNENGQLVVSNTKNGTVEVKNPKVELFGKQTISKYQKLHTKPMLIVGTNNYMRQELPPGFLDRYDVYLFFYANSRPIWACGAIALSRKETGVKHLQAFGYSLNAQNALRSAQYNLFTESLDEQMEYKKGEPVNEKLNSWLIKWIYNCPKISLKEVLHLEDYTSMSLEQEEVKEVPVDISNNLFKAIKGGR